MVMDTNCTINGKDNSMIGMTTLVLLAHQYMFIVERSDMSVDMKM